MQLSIFKRSTFILSCCALCLGVTAQELKLHVAPAVHVSWPSATNKAYQVEVSSQVTGNWMPLGPWIEGTGGEVGAYFDTSARQFFRVHDVAASGIGWLEGVWQGDTYSTGNSVPFTTQLSINNTARGFSAIASHPLTNCTATLDLLAYSDVQAQFHSRTQTGPCTNGVVVVSRINPTNVLYNWYFPQAPTLGSSFAVLSKRQ